MTIARFANAVALILWMSVITGCGGGIETTLNGTPHSFEARDSDD